jgi:hypothetical protein
MSHIVVDLKARTVKIQEESGEDVKKMQPSGPSVVLMLPYKETLSARSLSPSSQLINEYEVLGTFNTQGLE